MVAIIYLVACGIFYVAFTFCFDAFREPHVLDPTEFQKARRIWIGILIAFYGLLVSFLIYDNNHTTLDALNFIDLDVAGAGIAAFSVLSYFSLPINNELPIRNWFQPQYRSIEPQKLYRRTTLLALAGIALAGFVRTSTAMHYCADEKNKRQRPMVGDKEIYWFETHQTRGVVWKQTPECFCHQLPQILQ